MRLPYLLVLTALAATPVSAGEAGKLLPATTEWVVTVNVRQFLDDHKTTDLVQHYLEQWRLARTGDEKRLNQYYQTADLRKTEGITEQVFLDRARIFRSVSDALGLDVFQDVERVTVGFTSGDAGSWTVVVEGRFQEERFRTGIKRLVTEHFASFKVTDAGASQIWQVPDGGDGVNLVLLNARTLAITSNTKGMADIVTRASGKKNDGLSAGSQTLLDKSGKEHVAVLVNHIDVLLNQTAGGLETEAGKVLGPTDLLEKLLVNQVAAGVRKNSADLAAAGLGLSIGTETLQLQFGLEAKKPERAKELGALFDEANLWGGLALKTMNNDLAKQLADILLRERVAVQETTVAVRIRVPHEFSKQVLDSPWVNVGLLRQPNVEAMSRRLMSMPIWGAFKPAPGALEVDEVREVAYRDDPGADPIRHRLDMFLPRGKKNYPVVVLVHGGTWMVGDNRCCGLYSVVGRFLASQGIGVVLPNYRLAPAVQHPEHVKDVARAVAWTHQRIAQYGGNPERLFLLGHSAGGHLVSLLATDETYLKAEGLKTADIKGVIAVSGVYRIPTGAMTFTVGGTGANAIRADEMFPLRGDGTPLPAFPIPGIPGKLNLFGPVFGDDPEKRAQASPLTHVRRGLPPFLLLAAEKDLPTLPLMAADFRQALEDAGCKVRMVQLAKRNHNSVMFSAIGPDDPSARAILEFLRQRDEK